MIDVRVHGTPAAQGSKRYIGNGVTIEQNKRVRPWRADVKTAIEQALPPNHTPHECPLHVEIIFAFPRPKSHYRTGKNAHLLRENAPTWPANSRNDIDKLARAILDAATAAGAIKDDGYITSLEATKTYTETRPGARIVIRPIEPDPQQEQ